MRGGRPPPAPFLPSLRSANLDMRTVLLLLVSNVFMTIAWYGHLKYKSSPLWIVILVSWGIAFVEYCFQVPANRLGHGQFSAAQLKTIQEVISLVVFAGFSVTYLKEPFRWNYLVGFAFLIAAAFFLFKKW
jgi:uncharacterized protein (DUF486 family)